MSSADRSTAPARQRLEADGLPPAIGAPIASIEADLEQTVLALSLAPKLRDAMGYALLSGGKRLRPLLAWHSCAACGVEGEVSLPAGTAIEMIHSFSLVHDDLPAMDDDTVRRGRPTLHIHAGEAMAILAGDALHAAAFQILVQRIPDAQLTGRLIDELVRSTEAMISGQVYDTLGGLPEGLSDLEQAELIHNNKTGALIRASCRMGALCAGADQGPITMLDTYAERIGLMFQIVDDLIDVEQSSEHTGKRTGKDARADKLTYPAVVGAQRARKMVEDLRNQAVEALSDLGPSGDPLREMADYFSRRTR